MPRETRARVALVEDHPMFREQLAHLINRQPDMTVCAEANNAPDGWPLSTATCLRWRSSISLSKILAASNC